LGNIIAKLLVEQLLGTPFLFFWTFTGERWASTLGRESDRILSQLEREGSV